MKIDSKRMTLWTLAALIALTGACTRRLAMKLPGDGRSARGHSPEPGAHDSHLTDIPEPGTFPLASGRLPEPGIHDSQFTSIPELRAVHFALDRHDLGQETRETLKRNADAIKTNPGWEVLIEGHCDDRGTSEYNLALGQSRAKAVRDYYLLLGIPGNRVATISYGEEKPVCSESREDCWGINRRAENKIRLPGVSGVSKPYD
ncbi:MAG: hypothetical protein A2X36_14115 [Elusimicrobia bacterium GWA2_69_24]|nr:MAG: hypothetical protein A2X36_14115 [Elusimicrobia bacterium GWA2_69_24]HBL17613.1 hypothetical protein [Elusimicrobiota bacterium]